MLSRIFQVFRQSLDGLLFGPALDTVSGTTTAQGASLGAMTVASGDSFQVKNAQLTSDIWLLQVWSDHQAAGQLRVRSPKLHDNVDCLRTRTQSGVLKGYLPWGQPQRLIAQDTLIVESAGSATAGDIETASLLIFYADLPGQNARFIDAPTLKQRMKNYFGNRLAITLGSTAGYNGARAINADVDLLKANTDYAVIGMTTDAETASICLRGPDTGNLRVSVPGEPDLTEDTSWWFKTLSFWYGLPLIPVINSANKGATLIDCANDENAGTANIVVWLAELG